MYQLLANAPDVAYVATGAAVAQHKANNLQSQSSHGLGPHASPRTPPPLAASQ